MQIGFDNNKYLKTQSEHIRDRIAQFGGKLYLEFGGKLFDDYHASRVLPGFKPDSKITMLYELKDQAEIVVAINAADIEKNKVRGDLGITYDEDLLRLVDAFTKNGLYVGSVVLTRFANQPSAIAYEKRLQALGLKVYRHYPIAHPVPAAARWPPASPSSITRTSAASRPATPSSRPSRSGTCRSATR